MKGILSNIQCHTFFLIASSPGSTQLFNELDVEKREGLVRQVTCVTFRWKGDYRAWVLPVLAHA